MNQGTSMATPVVSGAVSLLLEYNPSLESNDILNLLTTSAVTDNYTGTTWNSRWGYGRLNIFRALINAIDPGAAASWQTYVYDSWNVHFFNDFLDYRVAVRFTPSIGGEVKGLFFHPYMNLSLSGPLNIELRSDNGGVPGTQMGSTVKFDQDRILGASCNYISLDDPAMTVAAGNDYHAVIYPEAGDQWHLFYEDSNVDGRSTFSTNGGTSWITQSTFDIRFRPVVATARASLPNGIERISTTSPGSFELYQNYPNPFNPETTFEYQLPQTTNISIRIYNVMGNLVREFTDGRQGPGRYRVTWDGKDDSGRRLTSGIYFFRMEAETFSRVRKMTLIR